MVGLARGWAWMLGMATAGCFPVPDPPWLIGDRPELLAVAIEVTAEGDYSAIVGPTPADRRRTEALPGDTVTLRPWVTDRVQVWNEADLDVAYFACFGVDCLSALHDATSQDGCTDEVDLQSPACSIGRGPGVTFVLPTGPLEALSSGVPEIVAVAGVPGVADTGACLDALRARPLRDLHECMLLQRYVPIGPRWVLAMIQAEQDSTDTTGGDTDTTGTTGDTDDASTLPPEVYLEWPNFNPKIERFAVVLTRGSSSREIDAVPADRLRVRAGDHVEVEYLADPRDMQQYALAIEADGHISRRAEGLFPQWFATYPLAGFSNDPPGSERVSWDVPGDVAEFRVDLEVTDGNGGVGWASLYFDVDGTAQ